MSGCEKLKRAKNRIDLAILLGFRPSALTSIVYKTPSSLKYSTFNIPKKNGGTRVIKAPNPKLKNLQNRLAKLLYDCLSEIDSKRQVKPVSYGFRKERSIIANAKNHKRRRYVLNLDLEDFFPAFNFGRVRGFFLKDRAFQLEEQVATTIAQIACDEDGLPQGSPCSPVISELIGQVLDVRLLRLAKKHGVRYSRYADDITFSTNQKEFPKALAVQSAANSSDWILGDDLTFKVESAGFKINAGKTHMHIRGSRQIVTGLVVNDKANIKSEYYRKARAMCDSLFQTGEYFRTDNPSNQNGEESKPDLTDNLNPLEGVLSHVYAVTQSEERRSISDQRTKPRAIRILYRRFLFYKYCIALTKPLIITEGKTDPVYLREAITHRSTLYPQLGSQGKDGFNFAVQFLKYSGQASEILGLGGGTGDLKSIPLYYKKNLKKTKSRKPFAYTPMSHPVILLLDNDDGLKDIASMVGKNFDTLVNSNNDFHHITENLYLVTTPKPNSNQSMSCIEDLFPDKWKNYKLDGKKFNNKNKINTQTEYGKQVFAISVVKPNAPNINFSGFDPLLSRIVAVLKDYKKKSWCVNWPLLDNKPEFTAIA